MSMTLKESHFLKKRFFSYHILKLKKVYTSHLLIEELLLFSVPDSLSSVQQGNSRKAVEHRSKNIGLCLPVS
jgi:hypothetical protein